MEILERYALELNEVLGYLIKEDDGTVLKYNNDKALSLAYKVTNA